MDPSQPFHSRCERSLQPDVVVLTVLCCCVCVCLLQAKRGLHSNKEVQTPRVNDVSTPGNSQRAKQYLPFLQRAGKLFGTVENVSSGELLACAFKSVWFVQM